MDSQDKLQHVLQQHFGFSNFRPGQREIIQALLDGQHAFGMLPTGGGKSLIYQMMGYLRPGTVVIVTPLLSLMQDQVARFNYLGEKSVIALNSLMNVQEKFTILRQLNQYRFVLISPEMFNQEQVLTAFKQITINTLVIDEAHTLLNWGPDFRPDYLELPTIYQVLDEPSLLLLTATATPTMQIELKAKFDQRDNNWFTYADSIDRPNIFLHTEQLVSQADKRDRLQILVRQLPGSGIIYVASRKLANSLAEWLRQTTDKRVAAYHGGLDNVARYRLQQQFMENQLDVIVATSAFGMGIDKDDIRYVIHFHLSQDLANYMQEIGRAGRDGKNAIAILLYVLGDEHLQERLIEASIPTNTMIEGYADKNLDRRAIGAERARLLDYYFSHHLTIVEIEELFKLRKQVRNEDLQQMVRYARLETNLRTFILNYFSETTQLDFESVGLDQFDLNMVNLPQVQTVENRNEPTDWQQILAKLFKLT